MRQEPPREASDEPGEGPSADSSEEATAPSVGPSADSSEESPSASEGFSAESTHESSPPSPSRRSNAVVLPLAVVLVASLLGNAFFAVRLRDEQDRRRAAETTAQAVEEERDRLRAELNAGGGDDPFEQVASAVTRIRGLRFRRPVEPDLLSPKKFRARVRELILRDSSRAEIDADGRILQAFGLLPADASFYDILVSTYQSQVIGFYDNKDGSLTVSSTSAEDVSAFDRLVLAHEYTHALTDQHFGLKRLDTLDDKGQDDEATAFLALIEGDAQLTSGLYYSQALTPEERRDPSGGEEIPADGLDEIPRFLREVLEFPYTRGLEFVRALHGREGFRTVDRAYRDPPVSTEQILHPSRYLDDRDDPVAVALPDVRRALGSGWKKLADGGVGELDLRVLVDEHLSSPDARAAAAGWDGGRYVGVESTQGVLVAVLTAWDSVSEAREAATMLGRWLPLRYGNVGSDFDPGGSGRGWTSPKGAGLVLRDEREVLLLLGPTEASVRRARGAFSGF